MENKQELVWVRPLRWEGNTDKAVNTDEFCWMAKSLIEWEYIHDYTSRYSSGKVYKMVRWLAEKHHLTIYNSCGEAEVAAEKMRRENEQKWNEQQAAKAAALHAELAERAAEIHAKCAKKEALLIKRDAERKASWEAWKQKALALNAQ